MTYDSEVLADSPWGFWKELETTGTTLADSSGNSRSMTTGSSGSSPTLAQTGPTGAADAISYVSGSYAFTSATSNAGAITVEAWVYLTAYPSSGTMSVTSRAIALGTSGAADGELTVDSTGKPGWMIFDGSANRFIVGSSALSLNTWHHMVGSVGAAGMKLRVDKVTVTPTSGTNPLTTSTTAYTGANQQIFIHGGGSRITSYSQAKIWRPAYYIAQLTDTRTDAHYDAMSGSGNATVTAVVATATATAQVPAVSATPPAITPPAATATASALAPTVSGTGTATVAAVAATATATALAPSITLDATVAGSVAAAIAAALVPTVGATTSASVSAVPATATAAGIAPAITDGTGNATVGPPSATATATALAPVWSQILNVGTDTANAFSGLDLSARAAVTITTTPAAIPSNLVAAAVYDKAVPYPAPVMVNGRPT